MSLEYDISYHRHCRLALGCGLSVTLDALHQWATYRGLIEGVPFDRANDHVLEGALRRAQAYCVEKSSPHLLPPERRPYLRQPGDMEGVRVVGGGVAEWLPLVTCVGVFKSAFPAHNPALDEAYLTVVWLQDEFALPIEASVLAQMRAIDWRTLATDVEL